MSSGEALIREVDQTHLEPGQLAFWWLGQHQFIVKMGSRVIYTDPYLHPDVRLVPSLVAPEQMSHANLVLGSHDHDDHIDREVWPGIARASDARFVVPELVRESIIEEQGIQPERMLGLDDGVSVEVDGVRVTGIAAAHEFLDRDPDTGMHPYLGYILEANGCKIYHAGDTCIYEDLVSNLQKHAPIDVAFLPINGRSARQLSQGMIGNMTYQEAVDLAGAIRPKLTIPAHYDMHEGNTEDPKLFVDYFRLKYPDLNTRICQHGESVMV